MSPGWVESGLTLTFVGLGLGLGLGLWSNGLGLGLWSNGLGITPDGLGLWPDGLGLGIGLWPCGLGLTAGFTSPDSLQHCSHLIKVQSLEHKGGNLLGMLTYLVRNTRIGVLQRVSIKAHQLLRFFFEKQVQSLVRITIIWYILTIAFTRFLFCVIWTFGSKVTANFVKSLWIPLVWLQRNLSGRLISYWPYPTHFFLKDHHFAKHFHAAWF